MRGEWGSSVELADGLWRIKLKNPRGHLMVNTFAHRGDGALAVIDPGWPWTIDALDVALGELGLGGIAAVDAWLYTHTHVDHMGAAALLQARSGAPHHVFDEVAPDLPAWHAYQDRMADWAGWIEGAFAPPRGEMMARASRARQAAGETSSMTDKFGPGALEGASLFGLGDVVRVGSMALEVVEARGHDPRHVAFWEPGRRWMFSGDAVLPIPTPLTPSMGDDVVAYEETLARLAGYAPELGLIGHGTHISGPERWAEAVARSVGYVTERREGVMAALGAAGHEGLDLWALCLALTPEREVLSPPTRWAVFLATTGAHVERLEVEGQVERLEGPRWRVA